MNDVYLTFVMILTGMYEMREYLVQENKRKNVCTLIISCCYFFECFFYRIIKSDFVSTIGCTISGIVLFISLFFRYSQRKHIN